VFNNLNVSILGQCSPVRLTDVLFESKHLCFCVLKDQGYTCAAVRVYACILIRVWVGTYMHTSPDSGVYAGVWFVCGCGGVCFCVACVYACSLIWYLHICMISIHMQIESVRAPEWDSKRARERESGSNSCANSTNYVNKLDHILEIVLSE